MNDNPRPDHLGSVHYRVKNDAAAISHATIRAAPHGHAAVLGRLHPGDEWHGTPQVGQQIFIAGVGGNNVWVRSADFRYVFLGALEEVEES